ncbi:hypothetical protein Rumeso_04904 [Rubellimicrobium mesophilum DSM 19309]|uniref:Uncharacterized protein n=1 Tax=Rubellimicrobium mesophilum DSM 19309 TaxID=442562 RepID=A0A017HBJ1_9RHOB|nr:hypothetical protein [Rubellimicrobium mesophilum]EYD71503.1 hypothetical protein Rumeso_04904 [Rubellimicrobium mesophilum DSM 19309]
MDDATPKPSIHITLNEATMAQVRRSAEMDRRITENDALNKIQPGQSEKAKAGWQGEGGSTAADTPLPTIYPKR